MNVFNKNLIIIFAFTVQMFFILILNQWMVASDRQLYMRNLPFFIIYLLASLVLYFYIIKTTESFTRKEIEYKSIKAHWKEIEELLNTLNGQRHQYSKHIQTIQALLYTEEYDELKEYINGIAGEYRATGEMLRLGNMALNAVVNVKRELMARNNIAFKAEVLAKVNDTGISSWDLSTVIGNILDNAIEAVLEKPDDRQIYFETDYKKGYFIFRISNNGNRIDENDLGKIFQPGYSTREHETRGYGLYVVKKILDKCGGWIKVQSSQELTTFTVYLPGKTL
ncbi:GHKL domain-containing protein [Biomaibacter acetigenes]|uniref:histidine kinase n=1 Tax=Biomaibacter acetigenes TaxID=2316383 RepID=A0A3G2R1R1_9FIRM|nr:GHKL domain-containing protein [Biomaibacter acetigenes]RKL62553.1 GHKL domain-containing protein [Thermoanaerobacteraceae bacterium SP2]